MTINPASSKMEWCISEVYPLEIVSDYDYQALNNQIKCIVTYYGEEYTEYTNFLFTKVGENGTNGTDIVAKISPTSDSPILDMECLALEISINLDREYSYEWNTRQAITDQVLDFSLFQRNEELVLDNITWTISGGTGNNNKYMNVSNGIISWDETDAISRKYRNQIVKASTKIDVSDNNADRNNSEYYAFYPVPVIYYYANTTGVAKRYQVNINANKTLKSITYNADGRNPLYNKNQGVSISFGNIEISEDNPKYIVWRAEGGQPEETYLDNPPNAAFTLTYSKNSKDGLVELIPRTITVEDDLENGVEGYTYTELLTDIYILPNDVYDGAYSNNIVHGLIYTNEKSYNSGSNPEVEIYIPLYMSLNRFGLQSLNAWDGNHLEINEDEDYILAPQIGAGAKDENNAFTGVVMGTAKTYDQEESSIGLLGYSHGKQSIWLDAETGNAIFGLPEDQATQNNEFTEGRIELIPGGDSKIGMWTIGSRALYNVSDPETGGKIPDDEEQGIENGVGRPYRDYPVIDAQISVPPQGQGIILNANPAYISVKGKPLTKENSNIQFDEANTTLFENDSLEVEVDPTKDSVFSIFRHTDYEQQDDGSWKRTGNYRRYPLVGINENGQFYTNAIEDGESSMGIGFVGAFKNTAAAQRYVGAQFAYDGTNLFKFFIDTESEGSTETKPLHISTGTNISDKTAASSALEYARPIRIYGDSITLYAPDQSKRNIDASSHRISISDTEGFFGHDDSYIKITRSGDNIGVDFAFNDKFDMKTALNRAANITTGQFTLSTQTSTVSTNPDINFKSKQDITNIVGRDFNVTASKGNFSFESQYFTMETTNTDSPLNFTVTDKENTVYLKLNKSATSSLYSASGLDVISTVGAINISNNSSEGISITAKAPGDGINDYVQLKMIAQDGGSASYFALNSQNGSIRATQNLYGTSSGVKISDGFATEWGVITSQIPGSDEHSLELSQDIYSRDMVFRDFSWNDFSYGYNNGNEHSLAYIIAHLWREFDNFRTTTNDTLNDHNRRINTAQNTANSKVDRSTYDSHTHNIDFGNNWVLRSSESWVGVNINGTIYHVLPNHSGSRSSNIITDGPR